MAETSEVEPAPLPRDQVGPFLLLGVDKAADTEAVEANWAERLKLARRQLLAIALEDINWARDVLRDAERRVRADVASFNTDLDDGLLAQLARRYASTDPHWQPLDVEPDLSQYQPAIELPDVEALRAAVQVPVIPEEYPAVLRFLQELAAQPVDPWAFSLPTDVSAEPRPKDPPP